MTKVKNLNYLTKNKITSYDKGKKNKN